MGAPEKHARIHPGAPKLTLTYKFVQFYVFGPVSVGASLLAFLFEGGKVSVKTGASGASSFSARKSGAGSFFVLYSFYFLAERLVDGLKATKMWPNQ